MEAFRVLPSLGGPGPPPAPPSPRVAPRVRQHKDSSAFVILAELGDAQQVSGRSSPFRGKGFKGTPSRIPVMSAPSSPGPKKPTLTQGKSAPASPSRPVPAKRVSVKPPQSPRKTAARPTPRPRFPQKTGDKSGSKEELKPNTLKKTTEKQNLVTKQPTNEEPTEGTKVKETTTYDRFGKPVINKATLKRRVKAPTTKINDPERLNGRPRPTDKLPSNNRTMTRARNTTNKDKKEVSDIMKKNEEANSVKSGLTSEKKISSTLIDLGDVLNSHNENTEHKNDTSEQKEESNPSATINESSTLSNGFRNPLPPLEKHDADPQKEENPKIITDNNNFTSANTATQNNKNDSNTSSEISQNASNNNLKVKTIPSMYSGTTAAMFVTKKLNSENTTERRSGTTKVDVESIKEGEKEKAGLSNKQETVVTIERVDVTPNKDTSLILDEITDIEETVVHSNNIHYNKHTPNGDISPVSHKNESENGTNLKDTLQNKIIIHQSDKNGPVKVIGSEPVTVSVDIDDVIKESIKTETVVAPNEVIEMATETARKEAQRDMTSVEAEKEESGTVIGSPDIEVEAGRNSVSFSKSCHNHKIETKTKTKVKNACNCCCCKERRLRKGLTKYVDIKPLSKDEQGLYHCCCCKEQIQKQSSSDFDKNSLKTKKKSTINNILKAGKMNILGSKADKTGGDKKESSSKNGDHSLKPMAGLLRATSRHETTDNSKPKAEELTSKAGKLSLMKKLMHLHDNEKEQQEIEAAPTTVSTALNAEALGKISKEEQLRVNLRRKISTITNVANFNKKPPGGQPSSLSKLGALVGLTNVGRKPQRTRPESRTGSRSGSRPDSSFSSKFASIAGVSSTFGRKTQKDRPASKTGSRPGSSVSSKLGILAGLSGAVGKKSQNSRPASKTGSSSGSRPGSSYSSKLSTITGISSSVGRKYAELRPEWTIEEETTSCCLFCVGKTKHNSEVSIKSMSEVLEEEEEEEEDEFEELEKNNDDEFEESEESDIEETTFCLCCRRNYNSIENQGKEDLRKPKSSIFCCSRSEVSIEETQISKPKFSEIKLIPASLESKDIEDSKAQKMWAVKTLSEEKECETPTKRSCFCCCTQLRKKEENIKDKMSANPEKKQKIGKHKLSAGRSDHRDKPQKCKICWLCCCCGCTCFNKPQMKSRAVQAESAEIRSSTLLKPTQLRLPSPNSSGDALVIQSVSSADNRNLTTGSSKLELSSQGSSKDVTAIKSMSSVNAKKSAGEKITTYRISEDGPALDPNIQRSVSAVIRHLSPERDHQGCFNHCCKQKPIKSPKSHEKSAKRKSNFCCFGNKKRKGSSQEILTSKAKSPMSQSKGKKSQAKRMKKILKRSVSKDKSDISLPKVPRHLPGSPEIHPVSARRKPTLREKLCGCYGGKSKVPNRVPLKERRKCCSCWQLSWFKRDRGPHPPVKENEKQGCCQRFFCCCCKPKTDPPKPATQKQGLCRRMFCCCCKPKDQQSQLRQPAQPVPPANQRNQRNPLPKREMTKPNFWKRMFCCKCQNRTNDMGSRKSFGSKRDMLPKSRASSIASFPKLEATLVEHNSMMKAAIPVMPICLAWTCLILNVFVPGTGTILSGFLCVCFGKPRFSVKDSTFARLGSFFINLVIGIGQMFTIIFCFVGWGWSIWWGVIMLRLARKYRRIKIAEKNANEPPVVNQNHDVEHAS